MKLQTESKNNIFGRQEVVYHVESSNSPTFSDMKKKIAEELKKDEETIHVYSIKGSFGSNNFVVKASIYDSKDNLKNILDLGKTKKERKKEAEEIKKAKVEKNKAEHEAKKASKVAEVEEAKN